uniref:Lactate/malate dehydrogenase N-terminal domain-containing protein n=1 Tax=Corethron hystrix TaxID=216773 RepID=A0A7S1BFZ9_9STRA|mmetsp:Transcript_2461/g.4732  ORF Transcript_2461/g.4732 Transcript_2461/m.4732 type:complete len:283 (+) Transcript_2461:416-1264(+)
MKRKIALCIFLVILKSIPTKGWIITAPSYAASRELKIVCFNSISQISKSCDHAMILGQMCSSRTLSFENVAPFCVFDMAGTHEEVGCQVDPSACAYAVEEGESGRNAASRPNYHDHATTNEDDQTWTRLAEYLVPERVNLILNKRVAVVGSSWISLLVARLGAAEVVVWDDEKHDMELRLLQYADQICDPMHTVKSKGGIFVQENHSTKGQCRVTTMWTLDLEDTANAEIIILTTANQELINDPFVNEILRRTDATILMDDKMVDKFSYFPRIIEGADIILW